MRSDARKAIAGLGLCAFVIGTSACGDNRGARAPAGRRDANGRSTEGNVRLSRGRPPVVLVVRDGDPKSGVAAAVSTEGIAPELGAEPAVALAAVVDARLAARGIAAQVTPAWEGYRVRALASSAADARAFASAARDAMLAPIVEADVAAAATKLIALANRPLADAALLDAARCAGDPRGLPTALDSGALSLALLESWRAEAHRLGRVAIAEAGDAAVGDALAEAIARDAAWPDAREKTQAFAAAPDIAIYEAGADAATAKVTLTVRTSRAEAAILAAESLGDRGGPLVSRLDALEAPASVREVVATAHGDGGCLVVSVELARSVLAGDAAARIAAAASLARQEATVVATESDEAARSATSSERGQPRRAGDPRDAAERAAYWELVDDAPPAPPRVATVIGVPSPRDGAPITDAVRDALERANAAWQKPVVEARTRVERGQGELWILFASPCGPESESADDAGWSAAVATAASPRARGDAAIEPWVAPDGVGILVHGAARAGESAPAHARRLADLAARAFAGDPLDARSSAHARASLLRDAAADDARALAQIAIAVSPDHPASIAFLGTEDALARASDASLAAHADALRRGPLRVAVLANADAPQAAAVASAVDRWVPRAGADARACSARATTSAPRAGTYAVERTTPGYSAAYIAAPLPAGDASARANARALAEVLDGDEGLLARALAGGLALASSARVVGGAGGAALVVRVETAAGALDAAVAQTRALLDRVRRGAITGADLARAERARARADEGAALDPRARLVALFRGEPLAVAPTLDGMHAVADVIFKDSALIFVALRPRAEKP